MTRMAGGNRFDWLNGTVFLSASKPATWGDRLDSFYHDPNNDEWGGQLCRVLLHETIHFWQFLSSAYVANIVQSEWMRVLEFEENGRIGPSSDALASMHRKNENEPFSAFELIECWARYWDVHTRHAGKILEEDGIGLPDDVDTLTGAYTSDEFDTFMLSGNDAVFYGRPYRWLLDRCDGNTAFANIVFPVITFCAFGSPEPIRLFVEALKRARQSAELQRVVRDRTGAINFDWLSSYRLVLDEAVRPTVRENNMPNFTGGWDVLNRGSLRGHPVFSTYLERIRLTNSSVRMFDTSEPIDSSVEENLRTLLARAANIDPLVMYIFPGQPLYREHLGRYLPPPRIYFANEVWHAETRIGSNIVSKIQSQLNDESALDLELERRYELLDIQLRRFSDAKYAARRGVSLE
ncbi:MAG: hypothetical protein AAF541_23445 [Pseudomonadota bacterium]